MLKRMCTVFAIIMMSFTCFAQKEPPSKTPPLWVFKPDKPVEITKYIHGFHHFNLKTPLAPQAKLHVQITASSTGGALFGLRGLAYETRVSSKTKLGSFATGIWKRKTGDIDTTLSSSFQLPAFKSPVKGLKFIGYNCNKKGSIKITSIKISLVIEKKVKTTELIEKLEQELTQKGFSIKKKGQLLIAEKPTVRHYFRVPEIPEITHTFFDEKKNIGSTYLHKDFKAPIFPTGPYIYGGPKELEVVAAKRNISLEQLLEEFAKDVKAHNCNTIYYANLTCSPDVFKAAVKNAQKHGVSVFGQGTGSLYLRDKWDKDGRYSQDKSRDYHKKVAVPGVKKYISQYRDLKGILGWMGREEPPLQAVLLLEEHRSLYREADPNHNLFTLYNHMQPMLKDIENTKNLPEWFGFDRYRFRHIHERGPNYTLATPTDLTYMLSNEISQFQAMAAKVGRPLIFVGQAYGTPCELNAKYKLERKACLKQLPTGRWKGWERYLPPEHGMYLQFWLAVSKGANGFLMYHYRSKKYDKNHTYFKRWGTLESRALVDDLGNPSRIWTEISNCIGEAKPLFPLFLSWSKEPLPFGKTDNKWFSVNSFVKDFKGGRFFVLQNTRIGEWDNNSPRRATNHTELYFDKNGLVGYQKVGPLECQFTPEESGDIYDVMTGQKLEQNNASYKIALKPGRGRVLYQGTKNELEKIRKELKL